MQYARLAERVYNVPLLILPDKAVTIEGVFRAHVEGRSDELPKPQPDPRPEAALMVPMRASESGYAITERGVAVVQMFGSLVQRAGGLDALSGLTGYNHLMRRLDSAMRDPLVRGIVLDVDSPGGEVAGAFELARFIADAPKTIWAVANEKAFSAAYLTASAAERLILPATALVGSIGVVMLHQDRSQLVEKSGVRYTPIFAGAKKIDASSLAPLSEGARLDLQRMVDDVYAKFVDAVVAHRRIRADAVRATEGGIILAADAIDEGFADEFGTLNSAVLAMQDEIAKPGFRFTPRAERLAQSKEVSTMDKNQPAAAATTATAEQLAQERANGAAQARAEIEPKARSEGATGERERIKAITTSEAAKDRPSLAAHLAFDTTMAADQAVALLAKAAPEVKAAPANALDVAMRSLKNPAVGADGEGAEPAKAGSRLNAANVYQMRAKAVPRGW